MEAIEKKTLAREKIIEWTKGIDEIKHPSVSWVKDEFERLNIRRVDRIKVSKPGDTKLEKCMVNVSDLLLMSMVMLLTVPNSHYHCFSIMVEEFI